MVNIEKIHARMNILQITVILVVSTGFGDDKFLGGGGGGGMVVAPMYPASRIKLIKDPDQLAAPRL